MNATPETFKPGERWLAWRQSYQTLQQAPLEMTCIEWSDSGKFVKVMHGISKGVEWLKDRPFLGERLPDVESGNNQAESPRRTKTPCGECACCRWEIEQHRNELTQEEREAILQEGAARKRYEASAQAIKKHVESVNNETR